MAYRIEYGGGKQYPAPGGFRIGRIVLMSMAACALFLGTTYRIWPEGAIVLDRLLSYDGWYYARSALETMAGDLRSGVTLGEAVTTFCRDVVGQGMIHAA